MTDYVSKEEIVTKIRSSVSIAENEWEIGYNTAMAEIMVWVKNIPAADVEPVKHRQVKMVKEVENNGK